MGILSHNCIGLFPYNCIGLLPHNCIGQFSLNCIGLLPHNCIDLFSHNCIGLLPYNCIGLISQNKIGPLTCNCIGLSYLAICVCHSLGWHWPISFIMRIHVAPSCSQAYVAFCAPCPAYPFEFQRTIFSTFDQNPDFKIRRDHQKISYEHRAYESVDVRSLFWVVSRMSSESSTPGLKGI